MTPTELESRLNIMLADNFYRIKVLKAGGTSKKLRIRGYRHLRTRWSQSYARRLLWRVNSVLLVARDESEYQLDEQKEPIFGTKGDESWIEILIAPLEPPYRSGERVVVCLERARGNLGQGINYVLFGGRPARSFWKLVYDGVETQVHTDHIKWHHPVQEKGK